VLQRQDGAAPGWTSYMADLPGAALVKQLVPRLTSGHDIVLAADDRRYPVPNENFKTASGYLFECAARAQAMLGHPPR